MLLFSRVVATRVVRGAGRAHTGHISVWGRTAVTRPAGLVSPRRWWGTQRVWSVGSDVVAVGPGGLLSRTTPVVGVTPGNYITTGVVPTPPVPGTTTLLRWIPVGTRVSQLGWVAQARGTSVLVLRHRAGLTECRFPSKISRWISSEWFTTVGVRTGLLHKWGVATTAGDTVWAGRRPRVRGTAMNPVDHPHGGGQGKTAGGRPGVTPWGRLTKGYRTVR